TTAEKRRIFRRLHESGCFVIPNPWDAGSARYLQHLGFKALATTSSGAAFSMGLPDADWALTRDPMLAHIRAIVEASDLPVNADFESGYADAPAALAENVRLCVETGVAGLSIEDSTGEASRPLYAFDLAVARIRGPMGLTVGDAAGLGVRRISVGGALARAAWGGFIRAAQGLASGTFDAFAGAASGGELNRLFTEDVKRRSRS